LKRKVPFLLFGLKRDRKERSLKGGTHMFFISPHKSEERGEKWLFFLSLRFYPCLLYGCTLKNAEKLEMKLLSVVHGSIRNIQNETI
jgi:hypothetical protein